MRFAPAAPPVRLLALLTAVIALALTVAACGGDDNGAATGSESKAADTTKTTAAESKPLEGKTIAYIKTGPLEYYELSAKGAEMAIEELGGTARVYNSNLDAQKELANVQDAVTQQVDGIVLFPLTAASEMSALRVANRGNIPISVLYGYSPELEDKAAGFAQVDFVNYARELGTAFKDIVPSGDVAIISGAAGRSDVTDFDKGFREGFGDDSRIVQTIDGGYQRQKAFSAAQDLIAKYPDLKGLVVGNEDMAVGAIKGLGSKIDQVAVASQNGSDQGNKLLEDGTLKISVGASPSEEAAIAVRLLAKEIAGEKNDPKLCNTPYALNTPGDIKSTAWTPTAELIRAALEVPCANQ